MPPNVSPKHRRAIRRVNERDSSESPEPFLKHKELTPLEPVQIASSKPEPKQAREDGPITVVVAALGAMAAHSFVAGSPLEPLQSLFGWTQLYWMLGRFVVHFATVQVINHFITGPGVNLAFRRAATQRIARALVAGIIPFGCLAAMYNNPSLLTDPITTFPSEGEYWVQAAFGYFWGDLFELWYSARYHGLPAQFDLVLHHIMGLLMFSAPAHQHLLGGLCVLALVGESMVWVSASIFLLRLLQKNGTVTNEDLSNRILKGLEMVRIGMILSMRMPTWIFDTYKILAYRNDISSTLLCAGLCGAGFILLMDTYWLTRMLQNVFSQRGSLSGIDIDNKAPAPKPVERVSLKTLTAGTQ
eukprot:comp5293_c0_seq1/m.1301 comp5293_c0_seq1/g.1301  ORF comp5293_c0_seq1/g.1301 comp5293_c0_seq1/m.1301 type:complete len:358 (-) comp5293_c0_seq1:131-1204(-)